MKIHLLSLSAGSTGQPASKHPYLSTLVDQVLDSLIVGGISGLSILIAAPSSGDLPLRAAALSFGLTFLLKLKEYRKL